MGCAWKEQAERSNNWGTLESQSYLLGGLQIQYWQTVCLFCFREKTEIQCVCVCTLDSLILPPTQVFTQHCVQSVHTCTVPTGVYLTEGVILDQEGKKKTKLNKLSIQSMKIHGRQKGKPNFCSECLLWARRWFQHLGALAIIWTIYSYVTKKKKQNAPNSSLTQSPVFCSKVCNLRRACYSPLCVNSKVCG